MQVSEARPILEDQEAEKLVNSEAVQREAVVAVEQDGEVMLRPLSGAPGKVLEAGLRRIARRSARWPRR